MRRSSPVPPNYTSRTAELLTGTHRLLATAQGPTEAAAQVDASASVHPGIKAQLSASSDFDVDVLVIGSGPAGYYGAIRAAQLGARVVVVEQGVVGGVCLNIGCIPTKTLLAGVSVLDCVKKAGEFGVNVKGHTLDIPTMMQRKSAVVKQLVGGVEGLFRKNKIRLIRGAAKLTDPHTVSVQTDSGSESLRADKVLIATGSVPALLPVEGLQIGPNVWTSTEALDFSEPPRKLLVIGAGAIGLEFGYMFARLGSEVTVVEMLSQILPAADTESANLLQKHLEAAGIKFALNSTIAGAQDTKAGKKVTIKSADGESAAEFDKVLVAVGRKAVLGGVGLDEAGVKHDGRKIIVNERMQTSVPNIYAAGDCVGEPMLAHVGWAEAVAAVENALGMDARMSYKAYPACVYTTPELASVGMTEEQARERYNQVGIGKFSFAHNGKALGIGEAAGGVKFVTEPKYGAILGVHMVGPHVTDLVAEAVLAVVNELTVDEIIAAMHPHPTLPEVFQEAAMDSKSRAIHK